MVFMMMMVLNDDDGIDYGYKNGIDDDGIDTLTMIDG